MGERRRELDDLRLPGALVAIVAGLLLWRSLRAPR
jgi:hypothetical protein